VTTSEININAMRQLRPNLIAKMVKAAICGKNTRKDNFSGTAYQKSDQDDSKPPCQSHVNRLISRSLYKRVIQFFPQQRMRAQHLHCDK